MTNTDIDPTELTGPEADAYLDEIAVKIAAKINETPIPRGRVLDLITRVESLLDGTPPTHSVVRRPSSTSPGSNGSISSDRWLSVLLELFYRGKNITDYNTLNHALKRVSGQVDTNLPRMANVFDPEKPAQVSHKTFYQVLKKLDVVKFTANMTYECAPVPTLGGRFSTSVIHNKVSFIIGQHTDSNDNE